MSVERTCVDRDPVPVSPDGGDPVPRRAELITPPNQAMQPTPNTGSLRSPAFGAADCQGVRRARLVPDGPAESAPPSWSTSMPAVVQPGSGCSGASSGP